jgi:5-methyltetrahydrofolate--homocysteine methyltransferase
MSIEFSESRWQKVKEDAQKCWAGNLGRPLIQVRLNGKQPGRSACSTPYYDFTSFYDCSVSAEEIVDAWDYQLSQTEFLGDAYPHVFPNFGPGSIAAYMGAKLENGTDTVWFHPEKEVKISELNLDYISDNKWFIRTKEVIQAAVERWQGRVQIGLTDLGGNMDILSTFRPSEKLMFDLFDCPQDVERLTWKAHNMWWRYFDEFNSITKNINPGYSSWARIFSTEPHYILQCDFCFMIGPDMFEKFVKLELIETSKKLMNVFYHLDGPGELVHLDSLLQIDSIQGIQWVPGAGQSDVSQWPEVYKKITNAGKLIHICSNMADNPFTVIDIIADQTGKADNIIYHFDGNIADIKKVEKMLSKYCCI